MQEDHGKMHLIKIDDKNDFLCLIDCMQQDNSDYMQIMHIISEQYRSGNLYGLRMEETTGMFLRHAEDDSLFCRATYGPASPYLLPCFYCKVKDTIEICWVQSKARRLGLGKKMIKQYKEKLNNIYN
jgi:hypothetical protein